MVGCSLRLRSLASRGQWNKEVKQTAHVKNLIDIKLMV